MRRFAALLGVLLLSAAAAAQVTPTVTLTVSPTSAAGQAMPTLTWNTTPAATSCQAGGGWTGPKAASGSQAVGAISATTTYSLTCTWAGDARADLTWTPPTTRTDGTALTNLAATRVYYGLSPTALAQLATVPGATTTTYRIEPLDPGTWYFALTAVDAAGLESARTATVSKTTTASRNASASATVTITAPPPAPPNPPTNVTIAAAPGHLQAPVFSIVGLNERGSYFGVIDLGKTCKQEKLFTYRARDFYEVDPFDVYKWGSTSARLAAPCKPAA